MLQRQGGRSLKPLICWENNGNTPWAMLGTWAPFHCTVCVSIREGCWEFLLSKQLNNLTILGLGLFSSKALGLHCDTVYEVTSCWKRPETESGWGKWVATRRGSSHQVLKEQQCYNEDSSVCYWQLTVQVADEQIGQTGSSTAPIKLD